LNHFIDEVRIHISSGNGGNGCVSFRREKYIPRGGPDGGDGGAGGNVIIRVQRNVKTLTHLRRNGKYHARNGQPGRGVGRHGADGEDCIIVVPPGTILKNEDTGEIMLDLLKAGQEIVLFKGGKGGQGNKHFATSRVQAPRYAQPGLPGEELNAVLELSLIADIGFVGFPNAGKSTLLRSLTAANPKIGPYPFTTKIPNLGVMNIHDTDLVLADIPGIIEGASEGAGLGLRFLKHISRVAGIAILLDMSEEADHVQQLSTLLEELSHYGHGLSDLKRVILATKLDLEDSHERYAELQRLLPGETILGISSHSREGLAELQETFFNMAEAHRSLHPEDEEILSQHDFVEANKHPYDWDGASELEEALLTRYNNNGEAGQS